MTHHDRILILDFGSQVTQLIARRVRESGVYCEIWPHFKAQGLATFAPKGIVLSGGPSSVREDGAPALPQVVLDTGVPVLGICYGQQLLAQALGGRVEPGARREFGHAWLDICGGSPLLEGLALREQVWMSHGDHVVAPPPGFAVLATSGGAPCAAIADEGRQIYGVQFHPEVVHTPCGAALLRNFTHAICGCGGDWTMAAFRAEAIERIRAQVGGEKVICGLSGGVDSAVTAVLLHEAIGEQLTCIYVDTGLMREGESDEVVDLFRGHYHIPLIHEDASDAFLGALDGVADPEAKRKAIGGLFIDTFERVAARAGGAAFLAQGTLYPDVIESVSPLGGPSVTIKSHHNVGGLPERMNMRLVEPLRELFKDEVRALGRTLGMPEAMVARHPFPGPGLAIRIPGAVSAEKLAILRRADAIFLEEIRAAGLYDAIWQAFAVLLPVRSVGVMGDARSYDSVVALRAVTGRDGMTADVYPFDPAFLTRVAGRIVGEVRGVGRVVYDVTSKPPGTIEWE